MLPDFDDFYLATRRGLVLAAFALTGDLAAARNRDPRRVRRRAAPLGQGRSPPSTPSSGSARGPGRWRSAGTPCARGTAEGLHRRPGGHPRRAARPGRPAPQGAGPGPLAALSTADIGPELGETPARVEDARHGHRRRSATRRHTAAGDLEGRDRVPGSRSPRPPRSRAPRSSDRGGRRRGRLHPRRERRPARGDRAGRPPSSYEAGSRAGRRQGRPQPAAAQPGHQGDAALPTRSCIPSRPAEPLAAARYRGQHQGSGNNSMCQATRFADPRRPRHDGSASSPTDRPANNRGRVVQTVEISAHPRKPPRPRTRPPWAGTPAARWPGCSWRTPTG